MATPLITGLTSEEERHVARRVLELGPDDDIIKPFDSTVLLSPVRRLPPSESHNSLKDSRRTNAPKEFTVQRKERLGSAVSNSALLDDASDDARVHPWVGRLECYASDRAAASY
jgi:DNA-binding response OmpR family regulator